MLVRMHARPLTAFAQNVHTHNCPFSLLCLRLGGDAYAQIRGSISSRVTSSSPSLLHHHTQLRRNITPPLFHCLTLPNRRFLSPSPLSPVSTTDEPPLPFLLSFLKHATSLFPFTSAHPRTHSASSSTPSSTITFASTTSTTPATLIAVLTSSHRRLLRTAIITDPIVAFPLLPYHRLRQNPEQRWLDSPLSPLSLTGEPGPSSPSVSTPPHIPIAQPPFFLLSPDHHSPPPVLSIAFEQQEQGVSPVSQPCNAALPFFAASVSEYHRWCRHFGWPLPPFLPLPFLCSDSASQPFYHPRPTSRRKSQ
ncbi:uncharacterized protein LOC110265947 isoform X2 [Arachis ipaensis]|uniref:uncharacterized protein LOC110265947 isoform X2 n=1 Tax=Arachis ipaensis TaxID=130454 RepID=UPI000A2B8C91|nr:uncharacterized protein LOC110265947 isoform X2 [Arachis ipaensis]